MSIAYLSLIKGPDHAPVIKIPSGCRRVSKDGQIFSVQPSKRQFFTCLNNIQPSGHCLNNFRCSPNLTASPDYASVFNSGPAADNSTHMVRYIICSYLNDSYSHPSIGLYCPDTSQIISVDPKNLTCGPNYGSVFNSHPAAGNLGQMVKYSIWNDLQDSSSHPLIGMYSSDTV